MLACISIRMNVCMYVCIVNLFAVLFCLRVIYSGAFNSSVFILSILYMVAGVWPGVQ